MRERIKLGHTGKMRHKGKYKYVSKEGLSKGTARKGTLRERKEKREQTWEGGLKKKVRKNIVTKSIHDNMGGA